MNKFFLLLFVMSFTTYLIRTLPFVFFRKNISNAKVQAFFNYIPYAVLTSMVFPGIFYATASLYSAIAGLLCALILSYKNKNLLVVAIGATGIAVVIDLLQHFL